jgi:hypothetical protein
LKKATKLEGHGLSLKNILESTRPRRAKAMGARYAFNDDEE